MNDAECINILSRVVAMATATQDAKTQHGHTQAALAKAHARVASLERALENIKMHASARVGGNSELGQIFFPALRDYVTEVKRAPTRSWQDTDGTSAAARWGLDFTREPTETIRPPRRVTF